MSLYLDASVVVPLFVSEPHTARARAILSAGANLIVSDLTAAEFASAVSRLVRMTLMEEGAAGAQGVVDRPLAISVRTALAVANEALKGLQGGTLPSQPRMCPTLAGRPSGLKSLTACP